MVELQPHEVVWSLATGAVAARCLQVVAELGVADAVGPEPTSFDVLAARCGGDADALDRVLRLLVAQGVFARQGRTYCHTAASELLRSEHPRSMRAFPRMMGSPFVLRFFASVASSVRTAAPGMAEIEPRGMWAYFETRPEEERVFGEAMTAKAAAAILAAVRRAASPGARVLVIENVLEDDAPDLRGHVLDVIMLAVEGGRERTVTGLSTLLGEAGFGRTTMYPTSGPMRIVEAHLL